MGGSNAHDLGIGIAYGAGAAVTGISGYMSSVMIFSRVLADWEICELYAYGPDGTWTNGDASCMASVRKPIQEELHQKKRGWVMQEQYLWERMALAESKVSMFNKANIPVAKRPSQVPVLLAGKMQQSD